MIGAACPGRRRGRSVTPALLAGLLLLGDTAADPPGICLVGPVVGLLLLCGRLVCRRYELSDDLPGAAEERPA